MDEFKKIPPVTRTVLAGIAAVTGGALLQLLDLRPFLFIPSKVVRGELWRLVTPFLFASKGLPMIFDCFLLFRNLSSLEESHFQRRTADLVWALIITCGGILAANSGYPLQSYILFRPLLIGLTHLWAQANPTSQVSLFGLVNIHAPYFPFTLLLLDLVQASPGSAIRSATGLVAAHLYWFLFEIYPRQNGGQLPSRLLKTPQFLINYLGNGPTTAGSTYRTAGGWGIRSGQRLGGGAPGSTSSSSARAAPTPTAQAGSGRAGSTATTTTTTAGVDGAHHRWGRGNRLGGEDD